MNMAKSRQIRLPGLESDSEASPPELRLPSACEFPDTPPIAEMGVGREEQPAEPVEPKSATPDLSGKTVYVIDSHSLIFQVFHALPEMTGPRGEPTGAMFGFARDMMYLLDEKKPDYLIAAFDMSGPTFRHELFAAYKEHRSEMPDELQAANSQHPPHASGAGHSGAGMRGLRGRRYSGDGRASRRASRRQCACSSPAIRIAGSSFPIAWPFTTSAKTWCIDAAALQEDWGISPGQVVDFQALVGDSVDNIPGVPLIGPKVAGEWLGKYGTLENLLAHADELPKGKRKENLLRQPRTGCSFPDALVRLHSEVPITVDWDRPARAVSIPPAPPNCSPSLAFMGSRTRCAIAPKSDAPALTHRYETIATSERLQWLIGRIEPAKANLARHRNN